MNNSKSNLGRRSKRPELKANIIFSMFQEYLFTYISASLQRHLAGTPNKHSQYYPFLEWNKQVLCVKVSCLEVILFFVKLSEKHFMRYKVAPKTSNLSRWAFNINFDANMKLIPSLNIKSFIFQFLK